MEELINFIIDIKDHNKRVDVVLSNNIKEYSRSFIQKLINKNYVKVNNSMIKASQRVFEGDRVEIFIPSVKIEIEPENIPIDIIYEDEDVIIINKEQGMVVHPAPGNYTGTLVNALLYHCNHLSGINGKIRPGIVHRLDKDTSGIIVVAKNDSAHRHLAAQIAARTALRVYWAIV